MPTNIVVPNLGPSIEEAVLVKWLVSEGDFVRRGMPIFSVETDKTVVDCESVDEGYLQKIVVPEGSTVRVDQILGELTVEKNEPAARKREGTHAQPERREDRPAPLPIAEPRSSAARDTSAAPVTDEGIRPAVLGHGQADQDRTGGSARIKISPRARKMAREIGLTIERLAGTGPAGRIVSRDVETFVKASVGAGGAAPTIANRTVGTRGAHDVPLTAMRRTIARRLTESVRDAPVFFATTKVGADQLAPVPRAADPRDGRAHQHQRHHRQGVRARVEGVPADQCHVSWRPLAAA